MDLVTSVFEIFFGLGAFAVLGGVLFVCLAIAYFLGAYVLPRMAIQVHDQWASGDLPLSQAIAVFSGKATVPTDNALASGDANATAFKFQDGKETVRETVPSRPEAPTAPRPDRSAPIRVNRD